MKRIFLTLTTALLLFILPAMALAKGKGATYVPPNQSAASQYTEDVPTAGGNTPSGSVHHPGGPGGGGSNHGGPSGGAHTGGSANSGGSGGSISGSTLNQMSASGSNGAAAASLAQSLAPASSRSAAAKPHRANAVKHHRVKPAGTIPTANAKPASATGQVVKTLAGSDAGSGIGVVLPIILIACLVLASLFGVARFRRPGAAS